MIQVKQFIFNPFEENTYILYDETNECVIIDAGCSDRNENAEISEYISQNSLKPVRLLNTHCHIDHILGNAFMTEFTGLMPESHQDDTFLIHSAKEQGQMFGLEIDNPPFPVAFLDESTPVSFGNSSLNIIHVPGHSPGHIAFFSKPDNILFPGDIIFKASIGRTDLPGGNHQQLITNITNKILTLHESTIIYPGHGPQTTVGEEKSSNPFLS
jgi:hydroxyacylglutathione hydrolase